MKLLVLAVAGLISLVRADKIEWPHSTDPNVAASVDGHFVRLSDSRISNKSLRVREIKTCENVQELSGWFDVHRGSGTSGPIDHLYFHVFASRHNPKTDPIIVWNNGGPGMLTENGPCRVTRKSKDGKVTLEYNKYAWNTNATMVFLDQPAGTGLSYVQNGTVGIFGTQEAAPDYYHFLQLFLAAYSSSFNTKVVHLAAESYGGRYLPVFADYIVTQNELIANTTSRRDETVVHLNSVMIGNGSTDEKALCESYIKVSCDGDNPLKKALVNPTACAQMKTNLPPVLDLFDNCNADPSNNAGCGAASDSCYDTQQAPYYDTDHSAYNIEKPGDYYDASDNTLTEYMNYKSTLKLYGVLDEDKHDPSSAPRTYTECSDVVGSDFAQTGDLGKSSTKQITRILTLAFACSSTLARWITSATKSRSSCGLRPSSAWPGPGRSDADSWSGTKQFSAQALKTWHTPSGSVGGQYRTYQNLTFTTINGAGHYVPMDQPEAAHVMEIAWVQGGADGFKSLP